MGSYSEFHTGWSWGSNLKKICTTNIPAWAADTATSKISPARHPIQPVLLFVGPEGSVEEAFLKTISLKNSKESNQESSMFRGSLR